MVHFYELSRFLEQGIERKMTIFEVVPGCVSHTKLWRTYHIGVGLLRGKIHSPDLVMGRHS